MEEYVVTFEQGGEVKTKITNAQSPQDVRFRIMNANGQIDYFNSICLNINDLEE